MSTATTQRRTVRGWLLSSEADELRKLAAGRTVLEVGTFCGLSAITMAMTARKVYCVDHFCGDANTGPADTREETFANFRDAGVADKIVVLCGSQDDVLPLLQLSKFDLVFYDAEHTYQTTRRGIELLLGVSPDAIVAFHDYSQQYPDVVRAVDEFIRDSGRLYRIVGTLAVTYR